MEVVRLIFYVSLLPTAAYLAHCVWSILNFIVIKIFKREPLEADSELRIFNPYILFLKRSIKDNAQPEFIRENGVSTFILSANKASPTDKEMRGYNAMALFLSGGVFIGLFGLLYVIAK